MKKNFKKRFRSVVHVANFIWRYLRIADNKSMSVLMTKSKSRNKKKVYYNLSGWYEPEPKEVK